MFERNVPEASLESWTLMTISTAQGRAFEALNRYFTSKCDAPDLEPVPISPLIDPHSILESLKNGEFLHGEENKVYYYQVHENALKGGKRYESNIPEQKSRLTSLKSVDMVNPQIFRIRDIVEVQASFIVAPLKNNKFKMIVVLRSIALLDPTFSQVRFV